ncbi:MAG: hypothetical protein M3396_01325 [Actinomycetota bacterium]|nr:hypothetical protein [Actinomycetota bacterium]MDQ3575570.1 hypothetical protein [Actinomycetota bacterium]
MTNPGPWQSQRPWEQKPPPPGQAPGRGAPPPGYRAGGSAPAPKTETMAIVVLGLAIASLLFFPAAIAALVLVPSTRSKIQQSGGALTGEDLCKAAVIISWIVIALAAVGLVIFVIFFAGWLSFVNDFNEDFEEFESMASSLAPGALLVAGSVRNRLSGGA